MVIGRFYFRQTDSGNLLGEFSNNHIDYVITECANLVTDYKDKFIGTYESTWFESKANALKLKIDYKTSPISKVYTLIWTDNNNVIQYSGEGFIVDNILIGDYRKI